MSEKLEQYLDEIAGYLVNPGESDEIIAEIRSNILEKTEARFGSVSENLIAEIVAGYGDPRKVAEGYAGLYQIIDPVYKKHFFLYAWGLMGVNLLLVIMATFMKTSLFIFPLFFVPRLSWFEFLLYLPVVIFSSLGLVGAFFYFLSQKKHSIRLPWPRWLRRPLRLPEYPRPKPILLILSIAGLAALFWLYFTKGTIFIMMRTAWKFEPILTPSCSSFYSWVVLAFCQFGIIQYVIRFFDRGLGLRLFNDITGFVFALILLNQPVGFSTVFHGAVGLIISILFVLFAIRMTLIYIGRLVRTLWAMVSGKVIERIK